MGLRAAAAGAMIILATAAGAAPPPNVIDQKKLEATYRAAKGIEAALSVGVNAFKHQELLQLFATEIAVVRDKATTGNERLLVDLYAEAASLFATAGQSWANEAARQELWTRALARLAIANQLYNAPSASVAVAAARAQRELRELAARERADAERAATDAASRRKAAQAAAAQQEKAYREMVAREEAEAARAAERAAEKDRQRYEQSLRDPDAGTREMAARVLGERRAASAWAVPQLIVMMTSDPNEETRAGARAALRLIGTPEAERALSEGVTRALQEPIEILKDQARSAFDRSFAAKKVAEIINQNPFTPAEAVLSGFQALAEAAVSPEFSVASPSQSALVLLAGPGRADSVKVNCGPTGTRDGCLGAIRPTRP